MGVYQELIERLVVGLRDVFGNGIESIILFGSTARGTSSEESDIDIAIIAHEYTDEMHDKMLDLAVDLELEFNKVLSLILVDYGSYTKWSDVSPFYRNMKKDGIVLWKAA